MKGTIVDFLNLVAGNPDLAQDIIALAARYDFEFTDEIPLEELDHVAGGTTPQEETTAFENYDQKTNQLFNMLSTVLKGRKEMQSGVTRNIL